MSGPPGHSSARGAPALIPAHTASAISMARAAFAGPVRHVYVHVPFCRARCDYCDFASTAVGDASDGRMLDAYVEGVAAEWELEAVALATRATGHHIAAGSGLGRLHTLYFGGGTPSLLGPDRLERLLELFRPHLTAHAEVTVECNPEDVDDALATWAADAPVARGAGAARGLRISLGVQSLAPRLREALGRRAQADPADAFRRLRSAGVANLSVDLIQGIPGQTMAGLEADIGTALDLTPDHISWYELTLVPGTPLARRLEDHESGAEGEGQLVHDTGGAICGAAPGARFGAEFDADRGAEFGAEGGGIGTASAAVSGTAADAAADARADHFERIVRSLSHAGYDWYEVSNFALPGRRARHNVAYWRARPYLGLGPGAVSTVGARRWRNRPGPAAWAAALAAGRRPPREEERLAAATRQRERLMLAARCGLAVPVSELGGSLDADAARRLAAAGLVSLHSGTIRVTRKGRYVANEVCVRLFRDTYLRG
jgi:oxygen-independent coproporphyrinogen-3 oxidase